jgi:hypothetical protein
VPSCQMHWRKLQKLKFESVVAIRITLVICCVRALFRKENEEAQQGMLVCEPVIVSFDKF